MLAFALLGGLVYVVAIGPELLTEAFEVILAGSLGRRAPWTAHSRWPTHVVRSTALPFFFVTMLTVAFGAFAQELCPEALRLRDVVECIGR